MANYRPEVDNAIPLILMKPIYKNSYGVKEKVFPTIEEAMNDKTYQALFFGNFKTFGGTERNVNGVYSIEDTANIETWYRPDITSECRVAVANTGAIYDVIGEPENINMRNQFLKLKVRRVKGGA